MKCRDADVISMVKKLKLADKTLPIDLMVLSFNGLSTSKDFLQKLYQNTNGDEFHLIWLDNGSTDGTVEYLRSYFDDKENVSYLESDSNLGVINGRNELFEFSSNRDNPAQFLMFLDNDQFVSKGWLGHHLAVLNRGYDFIGVEAWRMNHNFLPVEKIDKCGKVFSYIGCGGSLIKRKVVDKIGFFDKRFNPSYFEDPDYTFRAYDEGFKIGWNMKAKIIHLPHQTLGKISKTEVSQRFSNSFRAFREKWRGRQLPVFKQIHLPEFD